MGRGAKIFKCSIMWLGVIAFFMIVGFLLKLGLNEKEGPDETVVRVIPKIRLELDGVTLDEINAGSKNIKYTGNEMILVDGSNEYYFDDVEIKGRGNASWTMNKRSYRIKLDEKVNLFGMGKIRKWAMISNDKDDSLMRNDLGYYIANLLYEDYPIQGWFVKFEVDQKDLGLYYASELVTIDKNSVDLKSPLGILMELDNVYYEQEESYNRTKLSDFMTVKDVVVEDDMDEAIELFMRHYNKFEAAIERGDYEAAAKEMDMDSLARYYLLSEISSNPDAYVTSWYLYKDGDEDKIHSSIGWDFDGAFGNEKWWDRDDELYSPRELMARMKTSIDGWDDYDGSVKRCGLLRGTLVSPVMCYMIDMPEFRDLVIRLYREKLAGRREEIISYIHNTADYIGDEAIIDSTLWNKGDFDEGIEYLVWWVEARFDYLDELFGWGWPESVEL